MRKQRRDGFHLLGRNGRRGYRHWPNLSLHDPELFLLCGQTDTVFGASVRHRQSGTAVDEETRHIRAFSMAVQSLPER